MASKEQIELVRELSALKDSRVLPILGEHFAAIESVCAAAERTADLESKLYGHEEARAFLADELEKMRAENAKLRSLRVVGFDCSEGCRMAYVAIPDSVLIRAPSLLGELFDAALESEADDA